MRNFFAAVLLTVVSIFGASVASAQDKEVYFGYQAVVQDVDFADRASFIDRSKTIHGVNTSFTGYVSDSVGITGEVGANFTGDSRFDDSLVTAMGGLTLKARGNETFKPFVRGLVGVARKRAANELFTNFTDTRDVGLAFATGGGLDIQVDKHVAIRAFQVDYLQTRLFNETQHNFRAGAGLVLNF